MTIKPDNIVSFSQACDLLYEELRHRVDSSLLTKRLIIQMQHSADVYTDAGVRRFHPENIELLIKLLHIGLRATGLYRRAKRNAVEYRIVRRDITFPGLPREFDGFSILHLSDMHIDGLPDNGAALIDIVRHLNCDLCVMTGDYRFLTHGPFDRAIELMTSVVYNIDSRHGCYAILGNHDFIDTVPPLEKTGLRFLINESMRIEQNGATIFLAGLDDNNFYGTHDLDAALDGRRVNEFTILLAHTPELIHQASGLDVHLYLCGHTHGGQVCLPGGFPLITFTSAENCHISGAWQYNGMDGYTSRGAGCSGLPVRFFCPPEITVHRLRTAVSRL